MPQKLTLLGYLEGRGTVKALTRIEAEVFGIPYPLQSGWPARHGAMEITAGMLEQLAQRIGSAKQSTASKARRGLEGTEGRCVHQPKPEVCSSTGKGPLIAKERNLLSQTTFPKADRNSSGATPHGRARQASLMPELTINGFARRRARRFRIVTR